MMSRRLSGVDGREFEHAAVGPMLELDLESATDRARLGVANLPPTVNSHAVWLLRLSAQDGLSNELWPLLAADERARAEAFRVVHARNQYVQVRGALRVLLGRCLGVPAADVRFRYSLLNKPSLADHDDWHFNVSHSGQYALVCIAHGQEVGVDIEQHRVPLELEAMLKMVLSPAEIVQWLAQPPDRRTATFFAAWTAKEAVAKAVGQGLRLDFPALSVGDWNEEPRSGMRRVAVGALGDCQLATLPAPNGYAAALALRQG